MGRVVWLALITFYSFSAVADGISFVTIGGNIDVRATEQRAVMWLRNGVWEIHIQPVFDRQAGSAAWVIPFSVRPEVEEGNADFFDDLELITSPVFIKVCKEDSPTNRGCFGRSAGTLGANGIEDGEILVHLWERGTVGLLEYAVISASEGDRIGTWLEDEGFEISQEAARFLGNYETEGTFFFAAKISPEADPAKPLPPVRFLLPDMQQPSYPLRLTALGVPPGEKLDLTLWVVAPNHTDYSPSSHSESSFNIRPIDRKEFDQVVESFFALVPDGLLQLYGGFISDWGVMDGYFYHYSGPISFKELGVEKPAQWSPELIRIDFDSYWIKRYQARLSSSSMGRDLVFTKTSDSGLADHVTNVYEQYTCEEETASMNWLLSLLVFLGMVLGRKYRWNRV